MEIAKKVQLEEHLEREKPDSEVEMEKKVQLEEHIETEKCKLFEIWDNPEYIDGIQEDIRNKIERQNGGLKVRQEGINLLKGRLTNQITRIKETISTVLDKDTSLAKKIWMLFREQGIMIISILTAIGMAIGVLVKALLPSGRGGMAEVVRTKQRT